MKAKRLFVGFFILIFGLFLVACTDNKVSVEFKISDVMGYEATIDSNSRTIDFTVGNNVDSFNTDDIVVPEKLYIESYRDVNYEQYLGKTLYLDYGLNVFYFKLIYKDDPNYYEDWVLNITRLYAQKNEPMEIVSVDWINIWNQNDKFINGTITVLMSNGEEETFSLTEDMVPDFDTSEAGDFIIKIFYEDLAYEYPITVLPDLDVKKIEVVGWANEYFINDSFIDGQLLIIYSDDSSQVISLTEQMVSGFTTNSVGKYNVTVSFMGYKFDLSYTVIDSTVVSIIIPDNYPNRYARNQGFEPFEATAVLSNGDSIKFTVTESMLSGFDTSTIGEKTITLTYKGVTVNFYIEVIDELPMVSLDAASMIYELNDNGKTARLCLTFSDGKQEYVEINLDEIEGFDTSTTGWKEATISYLGTEIKLTYLVTSEEYGDYILPTPSHPNEAIAREVSDLIYGMYKQFLLGYSPNDYDFTDELDEFAKIFLDIVSKAGIESDELTKIKPYIERLNDCLYKYYDPNNSSIYKFLTNEEILDAAIEALYQISTTIETEKLAVLLTEIKIHLNLDDEEFFIVDSNFNILNMSTSQFIDYIRMSGLVDVANDMESALNGTDCQPFDFDTACRLIDYCKVLTNTLKNIGAADLVAGISIYGIFNESLSSGFIDTEGFTSSLNAIGRVISKLYALTGNSKAIELIANVLLKTIRINSVNEYFEVESIFEISSQLAKHGDIIGRALQELDENDAYVIYDLIVNQSYSFTEIVRFMQKFDYLIDMVVTDRELQEAIINLASAFDQANKISLRDTMFTSLSKVKEMDRDNLTEADMDVISEILGFMNHHLSVSNARDIYILQGTSQDEFYKILRDNGVTAYYDETPIVIDSTNSSGFDTSTEGFKKLKIVQNNEIEYIPYYVYSLDNVRVVSWSAPYQRYYFSLNSSTPSYYTNDPHELNFDQYNVNEYISGAFVVSAIVQFAPNYFDYMYFELDDVEFVVDTSTVGLKIGYAKATIFETTIHIGFQYAVYDGNNQNIITLNIPEKLYARQYSSFYYVLKYGYIIYDYGLSIDNSDKYEIVLSDVETSVEVGTVIKYEIVDGLYIDIIITGDEPSNEIVFMEVYGSIYAPLNGDDSNINTVEFYMERKNGYSYSGTIDEINRYMQEYESSSIEIVLEWPTPKSHLGLIQARLCVYINSKLAYECPHSVFVVTDEDFYSIIIEADRDILYLDSLEELNPNEIFDMINFTYRYRYDYSNKVIYDFDIFALENNITYSYELFQEENLVFFLKYQTYNDNVYVGVEIRQKPKLEIILIDQLPIITSFYIDNPIELLVDYFEVYSYDDDRNYTYDRLREYIAINDLQVSLIDNLDYAILKVEGAEYRIDKFTDVEIEHFEIDGLTAPYDNISAVNYQNMNINVELSNGYSYSGEYKDVMDILSSIFGDSMSVKVKFTSLTLGVFSEEFELYKGDTPIYSGYLDVNYIDYNTYTNVSFEMLNVFDILYVESFDNITPYAVYQFYEFELFSLATGVVKVENMAKVVQEHNLKVRIDKYVEEKKGCATCYFIITKPSGEEKSFGFTAYLKDALVISLRYEIEHVEDSVYDDLYNFVASNFNITQNGMVYDTYESVMSLLQERNAKITLTIGGGTTYFLDIDGYECIFYPKYGVFEICNFYLSSQSEYIYLPYDYIDIFDISTVSFVIVFVDGSAFVGTIEKITDYIINKFNVYVSFSFNAEQIPTESSTGYGQVIIHSDDGKQFSYRLPVSYKPFIELYSLNISIPYGNYRNEQYNELQLDDLLGIAQYQTIINGIHYNIDIFKFIESLNIEASVSMNDYSDYAEYIISFVAPSGEETEVTITVQGKKKLTYSVFQTKAISEMPDFETVDALEFFSNYFILRAEDGEGYTEINDYYGLDAFLRDNFITLTLKPVSDTVIAVVIDDATFEFNLYEEPFAITDIYMNINAPYDAMEYFYVDYQMIYITYNYSQYGGTVLTVTEELSKITGKVIDIEVDIPENPYKEIGVETTGYLLVDGQVYKTFNIVVYFAKLFSIPEYRIVADDIYASVDDVVDENFILDNAIFYMYVFEYKVGSQIDFVKFVEENGYEYTITIYEYEGHRVAIIQLHSLEGVVYETRILIYFK